MPKRNFAALVRGYITSLEEADAPTWTTASGDIGSVNRNETINVPVVAAAKSGKTISSYGIVRGVMPAGVSLNGTTGTVAGLADMWPLESAEPEVPMQPNPLWVTDNVAPFAVLNENQTLEKALVATPRLGPSMTSYQIISGMLPWGLSMSKDGLVTGFADEIIPNAPHAPLPPPLWQTQVIDLGTFDEQATVATAIAATSQQAAVVHYQIITGGLPWGITLKALDGTIAGIIDEDYPGGPEMDKTPKATWSTASGSLGSFVNGSGISTAVAATAPTGTTLTYRVVVGALPWNLRLDADTGAITGNADLDNGIASPATTTHSFTVRANASNGSHSDRAFSITITIA
jgi:hypothetical protein